MCILLGPLGIDLLNDSWLNPPGLRATLGPRFKGHAGAVGLEKGTSSESRNVFVFFYVFMLFFKKKSGVFNVFI